MPVVRVTREPMPVAPKPRRPRCQNPRLPCAAAVPAVQAHFVPSFASQAETEPAAVPVARVTRVPMPAAPKPAPARCRSSPFIPVRSPLRRRSPTKRRRHSPAPAGLCRRTFLRPACAGRLSRPANRAGGVGNEGDRKRPCDFRERGSGRRRATKRLRRPRRTVRPPSRRRPGPRRPRGRRAGARSGRAEIHAHATMPVCRPSTGAGTDRCVRACARTAPFPRARAAAPLPG